MSLLSNPNPVRLGLYQSWLSNWYENNTIYSSLLYSDIYINEFLNGIFYKLKMPSSIPIIRDLGYNQTLISIKSLLYLKKTRRNKFRKAFLLKKTIKVKHRKILLFLKRTINKFKKKNNVSYTKLSFLPIFIFYKKIKNKKVKNINVKKKWNYLYYKINDRYYHFKKIKKKLFKKTKKFKLTTLNKKYNLVKKIKKNINRQKKYKKKNDKK